jgi:peptidoglycan/LPS O-acetylase OafA/YrhL
MYHANVTEFLHGMPIIIDWFFVASGFLITTLLLDETNRHGRASLRNFYTRRILRLFPAMYAFIGAYSLIMIAARTVDPAGTQDAQYWWVDAVGAATYSYNIVAAFIPDVVTGMIGHTWSLSVEEQFYFIWPLVILGVLAKARRSSDRNLIIGSIIFIAVFTFIRFRFQYVVVFDGAEMSYADLENPTWQGILYRIASSRPDMIVYGCLIAFVARAIPRPVPDKIRYAIAISAQLGWVVFAVVLCATHVVPGFERFGSPGYQLGLFLLGPITLDLYFRRNSWYSGIICWKPFQWLGLRAYGIYLWHVIPVLILLPLINDSYGVKKLALGLITTALGIGLGLLSYQFIEKRFLAMKDRFGSAAPTAPAPSASSASAEPNDMDTGRIEALRVEAVRIEAVRIEAVRIEAVRNEAASTADNGNAANGPEAHDMEIARRLIEQRSQPGSEQP